MITTGKITTLPQLDAAVNRVTTNNADYDFKRTTLQRQLDNLMNSEGSYAERIAAIDVQIQLQQEADLITPAGPRKDFIEQTIAELQSSRQSLVEREAAFGDEALLRREIDINDYVLRLQALQTYRATLDSLRPNLAA